jgi:Arc/MetJ-type ribon-helix-helix transcriptional regulator
MARPPKYASEEDKPVSVTLRLPRDLYDQAQQHAKRRQTTLSELVREGLQLRLETPTDPRDILATQDSTVMQEVRQMIADEVQAALAAQHFQAAESTPPRQRVGKSKTQHYSNATQGQTYAPAPGHSLVTEPVPTRTGGRPRSPVGQQILDLLAAHPEGLSADELRVYLKATKPIGDILSGMKKTGAVTTQGEGKPLRYVVVP